jgi:hypothetical protein
MVVSELPNLISFMTKIGFCCGFYTTSTLFSTLKINIYDATRSLIATSRAHLRYCVTPLLLRRYVLLRLFLLVLAATVVRRASGVAFALLSSCRWGFDKHKSRIFSKHHLSTEPRVQSLRAFFSKRIKCM